MKTGWTIEAAAGTGRIQHHHPPRFTAGWTSGANDRARLEGPCWTSSGSGPDDALHLFGWTWIDPRPAPAAFDRLMEAAAAALDDWIAERL